MYQNALSKIYTLCQLGFVSLTFRELSKIVSRKYTMPEITFLVWISNWNFPWGGGQARGGGGSGPPTPGVQPPNPANFFVSNVTPLPFFPYFFSGTPAPNSDTHTHTLAHTHTHPGPLPPVHHMSAQSLGWLNSVPLPAAIPSSDETVS